MALVCGIVKSQKILRTSAIGSHIAIYWTVDAAVTALTGDGGLSRLGHVHLPPDT
jgi:hypothetical protein